MQQTFEAGVDARVYMLRAAETSVGQAYKTLALQHLAVTAGDTVVDLGCGPVADLRRYAEAVGPSGQVVGVDHDDTAVTDARARTADLSQVQVWSADITALDLCSRPWQRQTAFSVSTASRSEPLTAACSPLQTADGGSTYSPATGPAPQ